MQSGHRKRRYIATYRSMMAVPTKRRRWDLLVKVRMRHLRRHLVVAELVRSGVRPGLAAHAPLHFADPDSVQRAAQQAN
jgi:hypothetical protein